MTTELNEAVLQAGVYDALSGDAALTAVLPGGANGVTAFARPDQALPYVLIAGTACRMAGTQGYGGSEGDVVLETYSRMPGGHQARMIAAVAASAVTANLSIAGQNVMLCRVTESATRPLGDGETYMTRTSLRVLCEPAEVTP